MKKQITSLKSIDLNRTMVKGKLSLPPSISAMTWTIELGTNNIILSAVDTNIQQLQITLRTNV
jgi:hypothetical protein